MKTFEIKTGDHDWPDWIAEVVEQNDYWVDFKVYSVIGREGAKGAGPILFNRKDHTYSPDPVTSTAEADVYLHGQVKWDGCSNWHFDDQDRCMLHFCRKGQAGEIGKLLERLYDIAAELMGDYYEGK